MVFSIAAFAIWTTWPQSLRLQNSGDYVPLWAVVGGSTKIVLSNNVIRMGYGWTYITTVISFVLLLFSTCAFSAVSKRLSEDDGGSYGTL